MEIIFSEIARVLNALQISETDKEIIKSLAEILIDLNLTGE